jgi:hypothetical protein
MDLDRVTRLWRILKTAGEWGTEGEQIAGPELKKMVDSSEK